MLRLITMPIATPLNIAVFAAAAILSLYGIIALVRNREQVPPAVLGSRIDGIPFIAGMIPFSVFLENALVLNYRIFFDTVFQRTKDPRVIAGGICQDFGVSAISLAVFIFFLAVWMVLRTVYLRKRAVGVTA